MRKTETKPFLRIGELARASGVNVSTVKFYIQQGLLEPAFKTSANMAYYHPDNVSRIQLIKKLQKEHFYPLSLIGEILSGSKSEVEVDLRNAIRKVLPEKQSKMLSLKNAAAEAGLSRQQMDSLVEQGVVTPLRVEGVDVLDAHDMGILRLVKRRCDAGLPFLQTLESFAIYTKALNSAVRRDVDVMIRRVIMQEDLSSGSIASLIHVADATLDEFVPLKRSQLDSKYSAQRMRELMNYLSALEALVRWLPALDGGGRLCERTVVLLEKLWQVHEEVDIAAAGSILSRADAFFTEMDIAREPDIRRRKALHTLRLGFFLLAPDMFGWQAKAETYMAGFESGCDTFMDHKETVDYSRQVFNKLKALSSVEKTQNKNKMRNGG